jgi:thiol-disulfide isomerase/thioredoxin
MDEWLNNSIKGGKYTEAYQSIAKKLNEEIMPLYQALNEKREALMNEGKFYTSEANGILKQASALSNDDPQKNSLYEQYYKMQREGTDLTSEAAALQQEGMRTQIIFVDKQLEYAKANPDITGYTLLVENIRKAIEQTRSIQLDVSPMFSIFHDIYEKKYPKHPYTSLLKSYMQAAAIKTGKPYPNVVAADANGREVNLSELIKGKVALIHLWASWCGPCRRHGMEMIPVYEKYKDKGFTVVGIAREQKKEPMLAAMERDKYPWTNLLELNDKNAVWTIFGIGNAGGGEFLVDAEGNFLAVNASTEEMKTILQNLFDKE